MCSLSPRNLSCVVDRLDISWTRKSFSMNMTKMKEQNRRIQLCLKFNTHYYGLSMTLLCCLVYCIYAEQKLTLSASVLFFTTNIKRNKYHA